MYLAIDIGGTKTLLASFSNSGELQKSVRFETPKIYSEFITALKNCFDENNFSGEYKMCVAGAPGKIDRKKGVGIIFGNLGWENVALASDIKKITGVKTLLENDANLAGLSEALLESKKYRKALYITISTGIGGVLIVDKKIDPNLADMEFGHMMFEYQGKLQQWEEFASGRAIFANFGMPAKDITDPSAWYIIARNIAIGLIGVIATVYPEVIIIGGGVGSHYDKYKEQLQTELEIMASHMVSVPPIIQAKRAEEAVLYGCYELARQQV